MKMVEIEKNGINNACAVRDAWGV